MDEQIRILCVDDERNVLRALERLFLDDDYEIITALSGQEGLEKMGSVRIVLSVYADTTAVVTAINEGEIYRFISKPWNDDELKVTLVNALERYSLHQHNRQLIERLAP